jgi:pimeloyl-ACP methyl ester carboxylesterase
MLATDLQCSGRHVHLWKGGSGPALLLLHSAWGDAEMSWSRVWSELSRSFSIIAPDMPGFGASQPPDVPSLAGIAGIMKELLDALEIDRAVVLGNSFGVAAAIEITSRYPARVSKLLAANGSYLPSLPGLMKKIISLPAVKRRFQKAMRRMTYSDDAFRKAFPDRAALPPGFFDRIRKNEELHAGIVYDAFMHQDKPQQRPDVPASIIWGGADRLVGPGQLAAFRKWLGNAPFIPIDGAGHMPQVDRPREFVDAVLRTAAR